MAPLRGQPLRQRQQLGCDRQVHRAPTRHLVTRRRLLFGGRDPVVGCG